MKDKQEREYAKLSELKPGDTVTVDGDFTCIEPWSQREVHYDNGLYISCTYGHHYLNGHHDDDGYLVGVYSGKITP